MGFLNTKKKDKLVAIFDVGSGSVGAALTLIPSDTTKIPTIIRSVRTDFTFRHEPDFALFEKDMFEALLKTSEALYNSKAGAPSEIYCVLASPWYISETRIIKMERPISFTFTQKIADDLVEKETISLTSSYKKKYPNDISAPKLIEQNIIKVNLDGYQVVDPISKNARQVEMNMIISLSPEDCIENIKETLSKTFHHIPITFSSFTTSAYLAIRDKYISEDSYILVDIGGEVTDIAIISKDILQASLSFPFGRKTFFRFLSSNLSLDFKEAYSLFSLYNSKTLERSMQDKMIKALDSVSKSWSGAFQESIKGLFYKMILPKTVFIIADIDIKPWFADIIKNEESTNPIAEGGNHNVLTLEGAEFLDMCQVKDSVCDPFLMIEAIAIMRKQK